MKLPEIPGLGVMVDWKLEIKSYLRQFFLSISLKEIISNLQTCRHFSRIPIYASGNPWRHSRQRTRYQKESCEQPTTTSPDVSGTTIYWTHR